MTQNGGLSEADKNAIAGKILEGLKEERLRSGNFVATRGAPAPSAVVTPIVSEAETFEARKAITEMTDQEREQYATAVWSKILPPRRNV